MKRKAKGGGIARPFLLGILFQVLALPLLSLLLAFVSALTANPTSLLGILAVAALLLSGGIYGFVASKFKVEGGRVFTLLSALLFSLLIILLGIILSGGKMNISVLIGQVIYVLTALLFSALGGVKRKRKIRK